MKMPHLLIGLMEILHPKIGIRPVLPLMFVMLLAGRIIVRTIITGTSISWAATSWFVKPEIRFKVIIVLMVTLIQIDI